MLALAVFVCLFLLQLHSNGGLEAGGRGGSGVPAKSASHVDWGKYFEESLHRLKEICNDKDMLAKDRYLSAMCKNRKKNGSCYM